MSVQSGKNGTVYIGASEEQPTMDWELDRGVNVATYVANDTGGVEGAEPGAGNSRGAFNMADKPSFAEGDKVIFFGWTGSDSVTLNVLIERIRVVTNLLGTTVVSYAVTFVGRGAITDGSSSVPA